MGVKLGIIATWRGLTTQPGQDVVQDAFGTASVDARRVRWRISCGVARDSPNRGLPYCERGIAVRRQITLSAGAGGPRG